MTTCEVRNIHSDSRHRSQSPNINAASDTSRTIDTLQSIPRRSDDLGGLNVSDRLVKDISSNIKRTASEYSSTFGPGGTPKPGLMDRRSSSFDADFADDSQGAGESKTHWFENRSEDQAKFSIDDVKRMVLQNIPTDVRNMIPAETWGRIFNDAPDSVLSEEIMSLQKTTTEEDVNDLVSYISVYVQREARGRARGDSDVSEVTHPPNNEFPRRKSQMDAVALTLETVPPSITSQAGHNAEEESIDSAAESRESRHASISSRPEQPSKAIAASGASVSESGRSAKSGPVLEKSTRARRHHSIIEPGAPLAQPSRQRKIGFTHVEIRYYEQILSDNPAVTSGPPIGIGWKYRVMKKDISVDAWEYRQRPHRRFLTGLMVTRHDRTNMLYDLGYNQKDIAIAVRDVLKVKNKRKQTYNNIRFQNMEEMVEKTTRRLKDALTLGMSVRKQRQMLAPYKKSVK